MGIDKQRPASHQEPLPAACWSNSRCHRAVAARFWVRPRTCGSDAKSAAQQSIVARSRPLPLDHLLEKVIQRDVVQVGELHGERARLGRAAPALDRLGQPAGELVVVGGDSAEQVQRLASLVFRPGMHNLHVCRQRPIHGPQQAVEHFDGLGIHRGRPFRSTQKLGTPTIETKPPRRSGPSRTAPTRETGPVAARSWPGNIIRRAKRAR